MNLRTNRTTKIPSPKLIIISLAFILIFSAAIVSALIIIYSTKPYDKDLLFYTDGFQSEHYYVERVNVTKVGWVNVTHPGGWSNNMNITFDNIKDFSLDLTSLCIDEMTDDIFFTSYEDEDYCFDYLDITNNFDLNINSSDPINISFVNFPNPFDISIGGVNYPPGDIDQDPYNGNWTYDPDTQTFYTNLSAGNLSLEMDVQFNEETSFFIAEQGFSQLATMMMPIIGMLLALMLARGIGGSLGGKCKDERKGGRKK